MTRALAVALLLPVTFSLEPTEAAIRRSLAAA